MSLTYHYNSDSVVIVYSTDDNYAKYLAVSITSLIQNASRGKNYEIYILSDNLSNDYCIELKNIVKNKDNIFIKFVDINLYIKTIDKKVFFESHHIKISAYYRLFIPEIFKNFSKVLYLDVDTIIQADVADLFFTDLKNYKLGVVADTVIITDENAYNYFAKAYLKNFSKTMSKNYFNSGVILYNLTEIDNSFIDLGIKKLQSGVKPRLHDQDILNFVSDENYKLIDKKWNFQILDFINIASSKQDLSNAKILHFISHLKPWNNPKVTGGRIFWYYARQTPFYEEMLVESTQNQINSIKISQVFDTIIKMKKKYLRYSILSKILFGKIGQKYKNKRKQLKEEISNIKII